jgi:Ca2+-binding EF-hand superfamily protein
MRFAVAAPCLAACLVLGGSFAVAAPGEGKKNPPDPAKVFAGKDTNKDGSLTLDEFQAGMKDNRLARAPQQFKTLDTSRDGKVSLDEFKAGSKPKS